MMKIYKIIADSRPTECLVCPVARQQKGLCGQMVKQVGKDGWIHQYKAPDDRCIIKVKRN